MPAFGKPSSAASQTILSRSSSSADSPSSPTSAVRGACRTAVVKRRLPRPPRPPRAITTRALACARSAIGSSPLDVEDLRAERHVHDRVLAAAAGRAPALAVHAALAAQVPPEAEGREVAHVGIGEQHDVAAVAAVAAVGAALGHELLAPEGDAAVAAAPGLRRSTDARS